MGRRYWDKAIFGVQPPIPGDAHGAGFCSLVDSVLNTRIWPTLIVTAGARLLAANDVARSLLRASSDWCLSCGLVMHRDESTNNALHAEIKAIANPPDGSAARRAYFVYASTGDQTLVSLARIDGSPAPCTTCSEALQPAVLITLNDGNRRHVEQSYALLHDAFAFTPSETRLTLALLDGHSLQAYSDLDGVRISTTRWHLRNALAKAGCANQRDLVRLVISILES